MVEEVRDVPKPSLRDYDTAFRAWQQDEAPAYSDMRLIQLARGYVGNKFVADFDMEWVMVTDEYGTDKEMLTNGDHKLREPNQ